jgi:NAD(P)-dependent dehydrogenase (short-subunit alcohol dehydrogenase family)
MEINGKVIVITGASSGIGKSLCERFANEGARGIVASDIDPKGLTNTVKSIASKTEALGVECNVGVEDEVGALTERAIDTFGHIDLFCSNAGIFTPGDETVSTDAWQSIWDVNLMSHVFAARSVLPSMLARGKGYLLNTSSAAGLLSQVGSAPYAVTKHAAVGFAEWLAITYGQRGIKVSVLCPQAVRTAMTAVGAGDGGVAGLDGMLEPEQLADTVITTLSEEKFLVLPHPEVLTYMRRKTEDYDRWLGGMQRLNARFEDAYRRR